MTKLIGVGDLFKNTWKIYREKFVLLMGLMIIPFLISALSQIFLRSGESILYIFGLLLALVAYVGIMWGWVSVLLALSDTQVSTIKEAYRLSRGKLLSFIWVSIILGFITGGSFVLFIIPGIILTIWLSFSQIIATLEGEKGLRAIVKSREYARDYFWPILGRSLVASIAMAIFYLVLMSVASFVASLFSSLGSFAVTSILSFFGIVINVLVLPPLVIYVYLLYNNLKQLKGEVLIDPTKKQGLRYLLVGLAGWVLLAIISIFFLSLLATLFAGLFLGQTLVGLNPEASNKLPMSIPQIPTEIPAGLTAEQQQQLQTQLEAMKKLQEQLKAQMPAGIPVPAE